MKPIHDSVPLAIVGGGAAGMFAAAVAAGRHVPCLLIERKARLGAKVLMTANGRCNFTRDISADQFLSDVGPCAKFVAGAIRACGPRQIIRFFKDLNVPVRRMADGRMFPADGKAATIVHAFGDLLRNASVPILTNCAVTQVERTSRGTFLLRTPNFALEADNVLLTTGGVSYPKTGSVGDGQNFARALGHRITPYRPGLIGLETTDRRITSLAGRRFEDGRAKVFDANGKVLFDYRGEVDCERFGLSGAAVYNCQRFIEHQNLKAYTIEVWFAHERLQFQNLKPRPVKEAIVTIGGVALDEVNPQTMESKKVKGLYFAGEVLDIDGPTGGYNLTLAFATAHQAVTAIRVSK
jgi:predicted Rossmann fold flavoprotein